MTYDDEIASTSSSREPRVDSVVSDPLASSRELDRGVPPVALEGDDGEGDELVLAPSLDRDRSPTNTTGTRLPVLLDEEKPGRGGNACASSPRLGVVESGGRPTSGCVDRLDDANLESAVLDTLTEGNWYARHQFNLPRGLPTSGPVNGSVIYLI